MFGDLSIDYKSLGMVLFVLIFAWASVRFFRRFSGHFEDFL